MIFRGSRPILLGTLYFCDFFFFFFLGGGGGRGSGPPLDLLMAETAIDGMSETEISCVGSIKVPVVVIRGLHAAIYVKTQVHTHLDQNMGKFYHS